MRANCGSGTNNDYGWGPSSLNQGDAWGKYALGIAGKRLGPRSKRR